MRSLIFGQQRTMKDNWSRENEPKAFKLGTKKGKKSWGEAEMGGKDFNSTKTVAKERSSDITDDKCVSTLAFKNRGRWHHDYYHWVCEVKQGQSTAVKVREAYPCPRIGLLRAKSPGDLVKM